MIDKARGERLKLETIEQKTYRIGKLTIPAWDRDAFPTFEESLEDDYFISACKMIEMAIAEERKACAEVCDALLNPAHDDDWNCERIPRKGKRLQWTGENSLEVMAFLARHRMIGELFREGQHIMIYREQSYFDTLDRGMWLLEGEDGLVRIYTDDQNVLMYRALKVPE